MTSEKNKIKQFTTVHSADTTLLDYTNKNIQNLNLKQRDSKFSNYQKLPSIKTTQTPRTKNNDYEIGDYKIDKNNFDILLGKYFNLPKDKSSTVKIFLSSTFSDFKVERNSLYSFAFPKIRDYCTKLDLDFQFVDMRWGVTEEISSQHSSEILCLQEVKSCKKHSLGPNFVGFIGNRYGSRSLPVKIDATEFELLKMEIESLNLDSKHLIEKWYKLDENNFPSNYVLLPLNDGFELDMPIYKLDRDTAKKYKSDWRRDSSEIQSVLQNAVSSCFKKTLITKNQYDEYYLSITEKEINEGLINNLNSNILLYIREFNQEIPLVKNIKAEKFTDFITDKKSHFERDESASEYLNKLKLFLEKNKAQKLKVDWQDGGLDVEKYENHKNYINEFIEKFTNDCFKSIDHFYNLQSNSEEVFRLKNKEAVKQITGKVTGLKINLDELFKEVLYHSKFCEYKFKIFVERDDVFNKIKAYFHSTSRNKPCCIHASSGGGKTSLLAMLAKKISSKWLDDVFTNLEPAILIRFLGTSSKTNNLIDFLESMCQQLELIYDETLISSISSTFTTQQEDKKYNLINKFHDLLKNISNKMRNIPLKNEEKKLQTPIRKPLIIIIDSIDQLAESYNAFDLKWIPSTLPPFVFIIFSCISNYKNILNNYMLKFKSNTNVNFNDFIIELPKLNPDFCKSMLKTYMSSKNRTLTLKQTEFLIENSLKSESPLYMKIMLDNAVKWRSFDETNIFQQFNILNQEEAISLLFSILEQKYGREIVSYSLGYLAVSINGLSDTEMDDLLSCNDQVLNEVYDYHDPPLKNEVRIPPLLWSRIKYEISEYLIEKQLLNKRVVCDWYHRKFREVAFDNYCLKLNRAIELNKDLAEIYLHENGIHRTINLAKRNNLIIQNANRMIAQQPLNEKNKRKLEALPYYLIKSRSYDLLNKHCFCNLKYILTKLRAFDLDILLNDFTDYFKIFHESSKTDHIYEQIEIIYKFLIFNEKPIRTDTSMLISLLIGQLDLKNFTNPKDEQEKYSDLERLLKEAHLFFESNKSGFYLKPLYACIPSFFLNPIKWYFDGFNKIMCFTKSKSKIIALKIDNMDEVAHNYGKHKQLAVINVKELKINYIELNINLNLLKCYLLDDNDNILYILYESNLSLYDVEKCVYLFDTNILWKIQDAPLNKSFYFFDNENFFSLANEERIMIRKHVLNITIWNQMIKPEKPKLISFNDSKKEIQNYLTDPSVIWEIRVGKFPSKNLKRSNIIFIDMIVNLNENLIKDKSFTNVDNEQQHFKEVLVSISKETENSSELCIWYLWKEGLKLARKIQIDSILFISNRNNYYNYAKYDECKLIVGLMNSYVHIYDIKECKLEVKYLIGSNDSEINRIKLLLSKPDLLIVSKTNGIIYFFSLKKEKKIVCVQDFSKIETKRNMLWEINNTLSYLVISDNNGLIHIFNNSTDTINFIKISSLKVSTQYLNDMLFLNNQNNNVETDLIVFSSDFLLNYIDLTVLNTRKQNISIEGSKNNHDDIQSISISNIIFGMNLFLLSTFTSNSIIISSENFLNNSMIAQKNLENSINIEHGVFTKNENSFIGSCSSKTEISEWNTKSGLRLSVLYNLGEVEKVLSISSSHDQKFLLVLTNIRQIIMINNKNEKLEFINEMLIKDVQLNISEKIRTYFTKNNEFIIYESKAETEKSDIKLEKKESYNLIAFSISEKVFTSYCLDGTLKSKNTGRYEILKCRSGSVCSKNSEILCMLKGNVLIWEPITEKCFIEQKSKELNNSKLIIVKPARILKKDLISSQYGRNMANFSSIPYFVTFLKHSLRLYDDYPSSNSEFIRVEVTACTTNYDGSIICTGDKLGYIIFWFRTEKLNKKFSLISNFEGLEYGYFNGYKAHESQINLLVNGENSNYLISSSTDRTIKIWNIEIAMYLCSIYTHSIISEIFFHKDYNLLIAIVSNLGNNKILAFKLFCKMGDTS